MEGDRLRGRLREIVSERMPLPGGGATPERHRRLATFAREDVSLAKLMEAHFDAVAILAEAGRKPVDGALYGVWASKIPGRELELVEAGGGYRVDGEKQFCSGMGVIDRAIVTAGAPEEMLAEVDLVRNAGALRADAGLWKVAAFGETRTGGVAFDGVEVEREDVFGGGGWYVDRPGFWHGACGPAACWAGGAAGLVDYGDASRRDDPHTTAHLGAMHADVFALDAVLAEAGRQIDLAPLDLDAARVRALKVRHIVEQMATDILRRFARAYGPQPLAMREDTSRRYSEVDIFLRQTHGERDLEGLGRAIRSLGTKQEKGDKP